MHAYNVFRNLYNVGGLLKRSNFFQMQGIIKDRHFFTNSRWIERLHNLKIN